MVIEGCDYSRTYDADWDRLAAALKANGKSFVGRYCVNDRAPNGRGISADEYAAYVRAGIEVFVYWESSEGWMLGGENAGIAAAVNAEQNILAAGMPYRTPIYFACDIDTTPEQQAQIDDCLRGCAQVVGPDRVGVYGSYYVCWRCSQNGTARWLAQTSAWSGGQWFPQNHLEQYNYNIYIDSVNMDAVRAKQENFGQASRFVDAPTPPKPKRAKRHPVPLPYQTKVLDGHLFVKLAAMMTTTKETPLHEFADPASALVDKPLPKGKRLTVAYVVAGADGRLWGVSKGGARFSLDNLVS